MQRRFWIGLVLGLLTFSLINVLVAQLRSDCGLAAWLGMAGCADDIQRAGFPFIVIERGGFIGMNNFSLPALVADIGVALAVSAALGWWLGRRGAGQTA